MENEAVFEATHRFVLDLAADGWVVRTVNYIPYDPLHPARTTTMEHLWGELAAWLDER